MFFFLVAVFIAFYYDKISDFMVHTNFLIALFTYYLLNPIYPLLIVGIVYQNKDIVWKALFASFLIVYATDVVGLPHCVGQTAMPTESINYACSDTILMQQFLNMHLSYYIAWLLNYIIMPTLAIYLALRLLGYNAFVKKITSNVT